MYKNIKEVTGKRNWNNSQAIKTKDGRTVVEENEIRTRWEEYIKELYNDERGQKPIKTNNEGPPILKEEIKAALNKMKKNKATGPDNIETEMLEAAGESGIKTLTEIANIIYQTGKLPEDMYRSIFITIPKKGRNNRMRSTQNNKSNKPCNKADTESTAEQSKKQNTDEDSGRTIWFQRRKRMQKCRLHTKNAK